MIARTCALLAFAAIAASCSEEPPVENEPKPADFVEEGVEDTADAGADLAEKVSVATEKALESAGETLQTELAQSNAKGFTVRNILGEPVQDQNGAAIAVVDDLLFDSTGYLRALVLRDESFLGLGGKRATVGADMFAFALTSNDEVEIRATLTNGELEQMTKSLASNPSVGAGNNPGNLISIVALLERPIENRNGDEVADAFDLVLAAPGRIDSMLVSVGGVGAIGNRLVQIPIRDVEIDYAQGHIYATDAPDFDALPTFEY